MTKPAKANQERTKALKTEKARTEYQRFLEVARELGAEEVSPVMDSVLREAVTTRASRKSPKGD